MQRAGVSAGSVDLVNVAVEAGRARAARRHAVVARNLSLVRSAKLGAAMRAMTDDELKAWCDTHPTDLARLVAANRKRKRRAEQRDWHDWVAHVGTKQEAR